MKKKIVILSSIVAFGMLIGTMAGALSRVETRKVAKADLPLSGTVSTNFKTDWDNSTASPDGSYLKVFSDGEHLPMYIGGSSTALFSSTINKGGATENVKIRNYGNAGETYYLYMKYNSDKSAGSLGSEIVFSATGDYVFKSISSPYVYRGYDNMAIYYSLNGSDWTKTAFAATGNSSPFNYILPVDAPYVKIAHYYSSAEWSVFKDVSLVFADSVATKTVTFDSQGGTSVDPQYVATGGYAEEPSDPTKPNFESTSYTFAGWYTDPVSGELFDFASTAINDDITLYAHWNESVIVGYTITYDTQGGTSVASETVPNDGTLFTKPANPTKANDGTYDFSFHNWYIEPECYHKFDFTATPTDDVTVYAGWSKKAHVPAGYTTVDPKYNIATWGSELSSKYQALDINTRDTNDVGGTYPAMNWTVSSTGSSTSGMKYKSDGDTAFLVNNTTMVMKIIDPQKYFSAFRIEFYVTTWNSGSAKTITLTTGGIISATGTSPYDSLDHSDLVLVGNCSTKPQEFTFSVGNIAGTGVRLRYIYATFGTYTTDEQALNFATAFNDANVCGTLNTDGLNETKWEEQETAYSGMSAEAKSILTNYDGDNDEILECLQRYDRVVYLHGESYDFMGRVAAGKVTPRTGYNLSVSQQSMAAGSSIIILVSVIALTSAGLFLLAKRKKEN